MKKFKNTLLDYMWAIFTFAGIRITHKEDFDPAVNDFICDILDQNVELKPVDGRYYKIGKFMIDCSNEYHIGTILERNHRDHDPLFPAQMSMEICYDRMRGRPSYRNIDRLRNKIKKMAYDIKKDKLSLEQVFLDKLGE